MKMLLCYLRGLGVTNERNDLRICPKLIGVYAAYILGKE